MKENESFMYEKYKKKSCILLIRVRNKDNIQNKCIKNIWDVTKNTFI